MLCFSLVTCIPAAYPDIMMRAVYASFQQPRFAILQKVSCHTKRINRFFLIFYNVQFYRCVKVYKNLYKIVISMSRQYIFVHLQRKCTFTEIKTRVCNYSNFFSLMKNYMLYMNTYTYIFYLLFYFLLLICKLYKG